MTDYIKGDIVSYDGNQFTSINGSSGAWNATEWIANDSTTFNQMRTYDIGDIITNPTTPDDDSLLVCVNPIGVVGAVFNPIDWDLMNITGGTY